MGVFLTGATGFVGRHVLSFLASQPEALPITCLVRDIRKAQWIYDAFPGSVVRLVEGDLLRPETYGNAIADTKWVIHCAALVSLKNGPEFYTANTDATRTLLDVVTANASNLERVVFMGSIAAVDRQWQPDGTIGNVTALDETSPCIPRTDYGRSKLQAEHIVRESGLPFTILRPAYIYGPYPRLNSSMDRLVKDVARGEAYTRFPFPGIASGIDVGDLAAMTWHVCRHPKALNEVFFASSPEHEVIGQVFELVAGAMGVAFATRQTSESDVLRLRDRLYRTHPENPLLRILFEPYFYCSPHKLLSVTDFRFQYSLKDSIHRTLDWYRHHQSL